MIVTIIHNAALVTPTQIYYLGNSVIIHPK
jgi:hypothetical protein